MIKQRYRFHLHDVGGWSVRCPFCQSPDVQTAISVHIWFTLHDNWDVHGECPKHCCVRDNASCKCSSNTCLSAHTISSMWLENVFDNEGWPRLSLTITFIQPFAELWYHFYTYWMGITFALYIATICGYLRVLCMVHTGTGEHHALLPFFPLSVQLPFSLWCCTGGDICHVAVGARTIILQSNSWLK